MSIRKPLKKIMSLLMISVLVISVAGCGQNGDSEKSAGEGRAEGGESADTTGGGSTTGGGNSIGIGHNTGTEGERQGANKDSNGEPIAMGRYTEEEIDLSKQLNTPIDLCLREDGSLVILDQSDGMLVSQDQGATWSYEKPDWIGAMEGKGTYIDSMYMAPDGTTAVIVWHDGKDAEKSGTTLTLVLPDGELVPVETELTEEESHFAQAAMGNDNRIIVSTLRSIYEVQRDGSAKKILTLNDGLSWIWVRDGLLFIDRDGDGADMPVIYDLEAEEYIEDEVLTEFVNDEYDNRRYNGYYYGSMQLMPGEEGTVYVAGEKGIHRHVIGGNMMEQIVDGNLSLLNNPNYYMVDMVQLENDVFLALFSNGKLIRFAYDPDIPVVPGNTLTIYSLKEDDNIRQAISCYQTEHPDVLVSYQIGMGDDDSVTRDDAVKKLNTEIMAGSGPDLIVMDDLPFDSYIEKGMLLDLTGYLTEYSAKEPLFGNVIEALKCGGKAYVAPAVISVPQVASAAEGIENVTDLSDLGEVVEKLRKEHPTEDIIAVSGTADIMKRFAAASEPAWITAKGTIDRDAVGEYLEQCKRIYEAQMDGLDEAKLDYYNERNERLMEYYDMGMDEMDWETYNDVIEYVGGEQYMVAGWTGHLFAYLEMFSLNKTKGLENTKVVPIQGQCSHVFKPVTMLGVSAATARTDEALRFMDVFLSAEAQSAYDGFPINQEAYDIQFTPQELGKDGIYSYMGSSDQDGRRIDYAIYWPTDEEIAAFKKELAAVNTAYIPDKKLEKAVFTQGIKYMDGGQSLEETLDEIEKAVTIYMAE